MSFKECCVEELHELLDSLSPRQALMFKKLTALEVIDLTDAVKVAIRSAESQALLAQQDAVMKATGP